MMMMMRRRVTMIGGGGGGGGGKMDMVMMRMGMCKKTPITSTKETTATPLNTTTINDKNSSNANPCGI